jgi:Icc protein
VPSNATDTPVLRIAQITDTHLYADPEGELLGLNTRHCLQHVVALAGNHRPQLVVATGDLTHDGSPAAYQQLQACFARLQVPVYCLPGNHDEADSLNSCMNGAPYHSISSVQVNGWQLAFVNSTVKGSDGGHLSSQELAKLDETLTKAPQHPAIVWLHHQPVPVGSHWLDSMAVDNPDDFFQVIDRHPQVRAIVWGHVHQRFEHRHRNITLLASPSTCIQFLPNSEDFAIDRVPPGYRWFELYGDGRLTTGVERLAAMPGVIDLTARGY